MATKKKLPRYRDNPYLTGEHEVFKDDHTIIRTKTKRVTVRADNMVDGETGEVYATNEVRQIKEVDDSLFVKVFTQNIKAFFSLKPAATKLLGLIMEQVQQAPRNDRIMLNMEIMKRYFEEDGLKPLSRNGFYSAIEEMTIKGFIAPTDISQTLYFINPHLFWNGDRISFVKEFRRTQSKQKAMDFSKEEQSDNDRDNVLTED